MATKNKNYVYEIKKSEGQRTAVYKQIFEQFGHTGSLMEFNLFAKLNEEEKQELCQLIFMVDTKSSHLLFPLVRDKEISSKDSALYSIYAMRAVTEHCAKHNVPAVDYISSTQSSTTAATFGFSEKTDACEFCGCNFYEFSKTQTKTEKQDETKAAKEETPRVQ